MELENPGITPTRLNSPIYRFKGAGKEYKVKFMGCIYCGFISANITSHAGQFVTALAQQNASRGILHFRDKKQKKTLLPADIHRDRFRSPCDDYR